MRPPGPPARRVRAARFGTLPDVLALAAINAKFTIGLLITFLGIGVVANVLIVYAVAQVFGERAENQKYRDGADDA